MPPALPVTFHRLAVVRVHKGFMTISEITAVAQNAGFEGQDLTTAVAIALAESGGNPNAHGDTGLGTGTGSFGLWQIYSDAHPEFGPDFTTLYDPQTNANAAYSVYSDAGFKFTPWTTFKTGSYAGFVDSVAANIAQAIAENPAGSIGVLIIVGLFLFSLLRKA